jgi:hypothetical protein
MARDKTIATGFMDGADNRRYGALLDDLANQQTRGNNQYPVDLTTAYSMLVNYKGRNNLPRSQTALATTHNINTNIKNDNIPPHTFTRTTPIAPSSAFTLVNTTITTVPGTDGVTRDNITCYQCNSTGHYSNNCPRYRVSLFQYTCTLTQNMHNTGSYSGIPHNWILLDSQSNISD